MGEGNSSLRGRSLPLPVARSSFLNVVSRRQSLKNCRRFYFRAGVYFSLGVHIGVHPEANAGITAYRYPFEGGMYLWGEGEFYSAGNVE